MQCDILFSDKFVHYKADHIKYQYPNYNDNISDSIKYLLRELMQFVR